MKKPLSKTAKVLIFILGMAVLVGGCIAAVTGYAKSIYTEGTVELEVEPAASLTALDGTGKNALGYISALAQSTRDSNRVFVNLSSSAEIDSGSVKASCSDNDLAVVKYVLGRIPGIVNEVYPSNEGDFGDGYVFAKAELIASADCTEIETTEGQLNDEGEIKDDDFRFFTIGINPSAEGCKALFSAEINDKALEKAKESLGTDAKVSNVTFTPSDMVIYAKINRLTDKIDYIKLEGVYNTKADVTFSGAYSALGTMTIEFDYKVREEYKFTYADVSFTSDTLSLDVGETEQLPLAAVISSKATSEDYTLSFESSDKSVAEVDKDGNVKAVKVSKEPVEITATLGYLGNNYTGTIKVYVTVPVKNITTAPSVVTLHKGDTLPLTCTFTPENATITDLLWFTEDDKVATVDENGVVTAAGMGETKVYAVSVDGHIRSSCAVTVYEGEVE